MQRSGTNFVHDLLALHPDVSSPSVAYEDHLFADADLLLRFAELTTSRWRGHGGADDPTADLVRQLGQGLVGPFAAQATEPFFVTKMPSMDGIEHAASLFPDAPIIVVVRDGRAVVESATTTFSEPFDREAARWADGARAVIDLEASGRPEVMVVRYEDLLADLETELRRVLEHIGLDPETYPFDRAEALPVRGSSQLVEQGGVHWSPVDRDSVNPEDRGRSMSTAHRRSFDRIAGAELEQLGYERDRDLDAPRLVEGLTEQLPSKARASWTARRWAGRLRRRLRSLS